LLKGRGNEGELGGGGFGDGKVKEKRWVVK
jgi:hypothetical protein